VTLADKVRNRLTRARQRRWRMQSYRSDQRHVVIGGSPRSGTTLLRRTLDRHSGLCCGPESSLFLPGPIRLPWLAKAFDIEQDDLRGLLAQSRSQGAFIDAFAERYRAVRDRPRWAEKTPLNVLHIDWILEHFPEASFIHVVRDGRDVICSMRAYGDWRWVDGMWTRVPRDWTVEECAQRWLRDTGKAIRHRGDPRYVEVRYEALVAQPEDALTGVLSSIGEAFEPAMLKESEADEDGSVDAKGPISGASVGRWRRDLTQPQQEALKPVIGARLVELGYADVW
jgi:protein-tyrosine sulfotransferase